jgi:hypothetical protein
MFQDWIEKNKLAKAGSGDDSKVTKKDSKVDFNLLNTDQAKK